MFYKILHKPNPNPTWILRCCQVPLGSVQVSRLKLLHFCLLWSVFAEVTMTLVICLSVTKFTDNFSSFERKVKLTVLWERNLTNIGVLWHRPFSQFPVIDVMKLNICIESYSSLACEHFALKAQALGILWGHRLSTKLQCHFTLCYLCHSHCSSVILCCYFLTINCAQWHVVAFR